MYFRLLQGVHIEKGRTYEAKGVRAEDGTVDYPNQPVVESDRDLVAAFGSTKFCRLSKGEAEMLLSKSEKAPPVEEDSDEEKTKTAKKEKPLGKDWTDKFEGAKAAGLTIFRQTKNAYLVYFKEELLTAAGPISRKEANELVKQHLE